MIMTLETLAKLSHQKNAHFDASHLFHVPVDKMENILSHYQKFIEDKSN